MANLSGVVQQLKKAHAEAQGEVKRLGAALAALGNLTGRSATWKQLPYRLLLEGGSPSRRKRDGQRGVPKLKQAPRGVAELAVYRTAQAFERRACEMLEESILPNRLVETLVWDFVRLSVYVLARHRASQLSS